jgi:CheY-like chemotaxis protein
MATTVIIIEDNPNSGKLAAKLLRAAGHTVHLCEDGESGYEAALEQSPNLVLVDLGLPDMDGQTVVALLRQEDNLTGVPMIAFTAYPPDTARDMARAYGCDGVITKPIDTRTFAGQVAAYLNANSEAPSTAGG